MRTALIDAGVYHAGLSIELDAIDAVNVLDGGGYSSVEYTFTVTNNDVDALYVMDPEILGDSVYHQWTNGVAFYGLNTGSYHQRVHVGAGAEIPGWSPDWYTRVPSGGSMTRRTVVQNIELLIPGDYLAVITYTAPATVPANLIRQEDGRYWLGHGFSEVVGVIIGDHSDSPLVLTDTPHTIRPFSHLRPTTQSRSRTPSTAVS